MIDAHHHLWDLGRIHYPWLMEKGAPRFFGDPTPIQRDYLVEEFRAEAEPEGVRASVHIQVGAADGFAEARWIQAVADANPDWSMAQVVFCDLTAPDLAARLDAFQVLPTLRGVRQIVARSPDEDATTSTIALLDDPRFSAGLREVGARGLSFDLQLVRGLMEKTAGVLARAPETRIALCHAGSPHDRCRTGLAHWASRLTRLSELSNVRCKLSGLGMFEQDWTTGSIGPIVDTVLAQFGPERVMFGSNFPVDKLTSDYHALVDAYRALIPEQAHEAVFRTTAAAFYGLS